MEKQIYSNQFPRKQDMLDMSIKERADFIFKNLEDKIPRLYAYITQNIENKNINHGHSRDNTNN